MEDFPQLKRANCYIGKPDIVDLEITHLLHVGIL